MTRLFFHSFAFLGLFALIATTGCSSGGIPVQSVTGKITYNGEPVAGATVVFTSADAFGHSAGAITAADGTYVLETHAAQRPGATVGDFHVFVSKAIAIDRLGNEFLCDSQPLGPSGRPETKHLLPLRYSGMNGAPAQFTATVEKGRNVFDFNLED